MHFFEDEEGLSQVVAHFLSAPLNEGEPAVLVATPAHAASTRTLLERRGLDVERAVSQGQITILDAQETLSKILVGSLPDADLFDTHVGRTVAEAARKGPRVHAYGEMVDLLVRDGNVAAAKRLEELWNDLARMVPLSLLCTYSMSHFFKAADGVSFAELCDVHARVIPGGSFPSRKSADSQRREVARLQQRAWALEAELERRKALEEEHERLIERLQRTVRFAEMFVGVLGHDLRNPLAAITTTAGLLMRRADSESLSKPVGRILTSADRMARMIDQILDFTRIRLGTGLTLDRRPVELRAVVTTALEELEAAEGTSSTRLACEGGSWGDWDADRVAQLVSNLVGNALQHRAAGSKVQVRLDGTSASAVTLRIQNEGVIPPELLPVIFEPFHGRDDGGRARSRGLGLGLFISREIVAAHGGSIEVVSANGETRFVVDLPRDPDRHGADAVFLATNPERTQDELEGDPDRR
ncbi:MAG TPA: ATP-binding protein [Thermoanaerobaculia bacterium]|nr:ATP-binding protein [Thermoanaerobaculia bacterium]